jgi:enterochelin esterase family protein
MKKIILFFCILASPTILAGNFERFISYLNLLPLNERQAKVDSFMNANPILPYLEDDTAVFFIYQGHAQSLVIAGDFTGWTPSMPMTGVDGTNFFYSPAHFEADARIEYKFVIDGNWILDPKNPHSFTGGTGINSEVRMPAYIVSPEISWYSVIPHGIIRDTSFYSKILNNTRPVKIYLPPDYSGQKQYPVIVFHDGIEYVTLANIVNILDYLIAHHEIEPVIGVFVPPVDRENEYSGSKKDAYTTFIVKELMPVIDRKFTTSRDPRKRATFGISAGGNIALFLGMKHPEAFGKIAAQSSDVQADISETFKYSAKMNLDFYLDLGKYDLPVLIPLVNNFIRILQNKNYVYQFKVWHEGHSWGNWESHMRLAIRQFFPPG